MKYIEKNKKGVTIEMKKGEIFDWIYFATTGIDIGKTRGGHVEHVEHFIPTDKDKVRIVIRVEELEK